MSDLDRSGRYSRRRAEMQHRLLTGEIGHIRYAALIQEIDEAETAAAPSFEPRHEGSCVCDNCGRWLGEHAPQGECQGGTLKPPRPEWGAVVPDVLEIRS